MIDVIKSIIKEIFVISVIKFIPIPIDYYKIIKTGFNVMIVSNGYTHFYIY